MKSAGNDRIVLGVASSALFDLSDSDREFRSKGIEAYEKYQRKKIGETLAPGVAFPLVQRLLSLNELATNERDVRVEVVVMSRNSPATGLRVVRSAAEHQLEVKRAIFTAGRSPYDYCRPLNVALYLTADADAVRQALAQGLPAGQVVDSQVINDPSDRSLRVAFDFDGVLADDSAERVYQEQGLESFVEHEAVNSHVPHQAGVLLPFLQAISKLQQLEARAVGPEAKRLRVSVITARGAATQERAINSLRHWGVDVDDAFFLSGLDKGSIVEVLRPHIFFDDQLGHLNSTSRFAPSVHVPFGVTNQQESGAIARQGQWDRKHAFVDRWRGWRRGRPSERTASRWRRQSR